MSKPGGCHSSGISLGDALRLPKRHPAWRRREAQSGSRKKLTCSGHATNSRRRAASLTSFHSLRVGNAGGRLVWNVRTWPAMLREKAQAAPTARPKVPMRRRGADCPVVVLKRLARSARASSLCGLQRRWVMERRKFTREFKLEAVRLIKDRGVSYVQASQDLNVHPSQLRDWVKKSADDPQHAFPGHGQMKPEQLEIARLKREVAKLKAERDILKKAAAYFAKEST